MNRAANAGAPLGARRQARCSHGTMHTNEEVRRLNDVIQAVEIECGRVRNVENVETGRGTVRIGEGDRIIVL